MKQFILNAYTAHILVFFMKSPEQIGGPPAQAGKSPEQQYNKIEWEKLKQGNEAFAIKQGRKMGVPQEELEQFAQDFIARETESQNYGLVYRFRKNMGIGTEEEVRAVGEQAYKFFLENGDSGSAMSMAVDMYGIDSKEWRRAYKANEADWKKTEERRKKKEEEMEDEERELKATISKDATFADLFNAIDAIEEEEGLGELHFKEELLDNFDTEIVEEVVAFRGAQANKAATTKVMDFFRERGYSQSDVSVFLPIKFKRKRKKK